MVEEKLDGGPKANHVAKHRVWLKTLSSTLYYSILFSYNKYYSLGPWSSSMILRALLEPVKATVSLCAAFIKAASSSDFLPFLF
jgi:hypothetical protein